MACFQIWWCSCLLQGLLIVIIDHLLEVGHATVADLDYEDFVEHVIFRELFVDDLKERSSHVCSHVLAKSWVVPNDVSVAVPSGGVRGMCYAWRE